MEEFEGYSCKASIFQCITVIPRCRNGNTAYCHTTLTNALQHTLWRFATQYTVLQPDLRAVCNAIYCSSRPQGGLQGRRPSCKAIHRVAIPTPCIRLKDAKICYLAVANIKNYISHESWRTISVGGNNTTPNEDFQVHKSFLW